MAPRSAEAECAGLLQRANLRRIQEILGHQSLATTECDLHLTIADLKEARRKCHPREKGITSD